VPATALATAPHLGASYDAYYNVCHDVSHGACHDAQHDVCRDVSYGACYSAHDNFYLAYGAVPSLQSKTRVFRSFRVCNHLPINHRSRHPSTSYAIVVQMLYFIIAGLYAG
jgi:hypothetical protein